MENVLDCFCIDAETQRQGGGSYRKRGSATPKKGGGAGAHGPPPRSALGNVSTGTVVHHFDHLAT